MSAIEIALHKTQPSLKRPTGIVNPSRVREWFADGAIRLAELIAGNEPARNTRPETAGNPWARPIGLGQR